MVLPSEEEGILAGLKPKNIPVKRLTINPEKVGDSLLACRSFGTGGPSLDGRRPFSTDVIAFKCDNPVGLNLTIAALDERQP